MWCLRRKSGGGKGGGECKPLLQTLNVFVLVVSPPPHSFHPQPRMEESSTSPSKVLHLRNLPDGVTEREVMLLGVPFGKVVNVLLLKHKNQAFLEMAEAAAASGLVSYYNTVPATIRYVIDVPNLEEGGGGGGLVVVNV